ncbi:MAG: hypothetical protein DMG01_26730, partial [Acidobacteria bacterium]
MRALTLAADDQYEMAIPHRLRTLAIPTVIAVFVTAGVGAISMWRVYDNDRLISHNYEVKSALDALLS